MSNFLDPKKPTTRALLVGVQTPDMKPGEGAELLTELVGADPSYDDQWAAEEAVMAAGTGMRIGNITWRRDELHQR